MQVRWVKYKKMGGPMYRGTSGNGYNPITPSGIWTPILGVVSKCEGKHDTVVMYDETGVTFGFMQWTFRAGRLQKMLQFLKSVPSDEDCSKSVFDVYCVSSLGSQIFESFGFKISGGNFVLSDGRRLNPAVKAERKKIIDQCMGRHLSFKKSKVWAKNLCALFVELGKHSEVQLAAVEFAKLEFKKSLHYRRPPLKSVGGKIASLLPLDDDLLWRSPLPAIFFNLYQNAPMGAFKLFKGAWNEALKKGIALFVEGAVDGGYYLVDNGSIDALIDIVWRRLNRTAYADWGFRSRQYLSSGGKNPPRIMRIRPAINEFYGIKLPYYKG